jgi:arabinogalactan endo-1,4-beta-galactosidase
LRTWPRFSAASLVLLAAAVARPESPRPFAHGICFAHAWHDGKTRGYGTEVARASLQRLKALGVDAISLTPFGYQTSLASDEVKMGNRWPGSETDEALTRSTRQAHALGMRVMLKPHIWIHGGAWIGEQSLPDAAAWGRWFDSYRAFIVHYAKLAEAEKMDSLVLGTELKGASSRERARWEAIIKEVRAAYHGTLVYAANWNEDAVVFWDLVDVVGIQAYEPPVTKKDATLDELRAGWKRLGARLEALSKRTGRPIVVTELGYRATPNAAIAPHTWPESERNARYDGEHQAHCFRAALEALTTAPWCRGVYIWKWFSDSADEQGPTDFSPAGKPAEKVLGELFRKR